MAHFNNSEHKQLIKNYMIVININGIKFQHVIQQNSIITHDSLNILNIVQNEQKMNSNSDLK